MFFYGNQNGVLTIYYRLHLHFFSKINTYQNEQKMYVYTHIHGLVYRDPKSARNSKGKRFKEALSIYRTLHMYRQHVHKS